MNTTRNAPDGGMWSRASAIVGGLLLVGLGVFLLAVNTFGYVLPFDFSQIGWPIFVIAPGVALLTVGLVASGEAGQGLAVAGGIIATIGGILAYDTYTSHWTSWAYTWTLIAPTAVGASLLLWGLVHRRGHIVRQGLSGLGIGLILFVIGFAFFEGVLNLGGGRGLAPLGRQALPVALIVAGALVILSRLWPRSRTRERAWSEWGPAAYAAPSPGPTPQGYPAEPAPPVLAAQDAPPPRSSAASEPSDTTTSTPTSPPATS
jgi:hypothetical protein